jgi:hypothetical protein
MSLTASAHAAPTLADSKPSTTNQIKTTACLFLLLLAYGFVGHMDYENEARAAAFVCERQYGQQAVFVETDDGWECRPKAAIH